MLERSFVLEDQLARDLVILAQHTHHLLGFRHLGESSEAAQVEEYDGDFATMTLQRIIGAAVDDEIRELRREEAPQSAEPLELADLLGDSPFQRSIPLSHLGSQRFDRIVQAFDS